MNDGELDRFARRGWPRALAFLLFGAAVSAAFYFGLANRLEKRIVERRGTPCVEIRKGPRAGRPSRGCERLADLLVRTCALRADLCRQAARDGARGELTRRARRIVERALRRAARVERRARARERRRAARTERAPGRRGRRGPPGRDGPPGAAAPPPASQPTTTTSPPPRRPTPTETLNRAKDRARDTANDATETGGAGRPVPPLPDIPPLPRLPPPPGG